MRKDKERKTKTKEDLITHTSVSRGWFVRSQIVPFVNWWAWYLDEAFSMINKSPILFKDYLSNSPLRWNYTFVMHLSSEGLSAWKCQRDSGWKQLLPLHHTHPRQIPEPPVASEFMKEHAVRLLLLLLNPEKKWKVLKMKLNITATSTAKCPWSLLPLVLLLHNKQCRNENSIATKSWKQQIGSSEWDPLMSIPKISFETQKSVNEIHIGCMH